jgi:hypothetical protein
MSPPRTSNIAPIVGHPKRQSVITQKDSARSRVWAVRRPDGSFISSVDAVERDFLLQRQLATEGRKYLSAVSRSAESGIRLFLNSRLGGSCTTVGRSDIQTHRALGKLFSRDGRG